MKFIRTPWSLFLNTILILLPWIVAVAFLYQFGQPALKQFKRFLGNPITEMLQTSRTLHENPSETLPYSRFQQQFQQIAIRDSLSDTEQRKLRQTTHNLYRGVVRRLDTGRSLATAENKSDSFFRLLESPLIPKIFERPDLLRNSLREDLQRLNQASEFPFHPARGVEQFLEKTNLAEELIRTYGELYADRLFCERMAGTECLTVYGESIKVISKQLEQYFSNWPTLHNALPSRPEALNERLSRFISVDKRLGEEIAGYLEAPPWNEQHGFRATRNSFLKMFRENLRTWYLQIIKRIDNTPEQFTGSTPENVLGELSELRRIERRIANNPAAQNLLWNNETQEARNELVQRLRETYHWLQAHQRFDTEASVDDAGLKQLEQTLSILPSGTKILDEEQKLFDQLENQYNKLQNLVEQKDYDSLARSVDKIHERARSDDSPLGWSIMLRSFLRATSARISRPGWQPLQEGDHESYTKLIEAYGEAGQRLQIRSLSNDWVNRTILAMKSRRFNQIKHNIEQLLEDLRPANIPELTNELEALQTLEDLPDELNDQPNRILFHVILLERIQLSQSTLFDHFKDWLEKQEPWFTQWKQINTLLRARENLSTADVLDELRLSDYVQEMDKWLSRFPADQPFVERIRGKTTNVLENFLTRLEGDLINWIEQPQQGPDTQRLRERVQILREAGELARQIDGVSYSFNADPWINLLSLRQRLEGTIQQTRKIEKGSLMGTNTSYNQYKTQLENYEYKPLPANYDPKFEWEQFRTLHSEVIRRAREIQSSSQEDWLVGWGGRITGNEVLKPWKQFLERWNAELGQDFPRDEFQRWLQAIQQREQDWS